MHIYKLLIDCVRSPCGLSTSIVCDKNLLTSFNCKLFVPPLAACLVNHFYWTVPIKSTFQHSYWPLRLSDFLGSKNIFSNRVASIVTCPFLYKNLYLHTNMHITQLYRKEFKRFSCFSRFL